jgi:hypothetical protein
MANALSTHLVGIGCVPEFWSKCIPCGGTIAAAFLRRHGVSVAPPNIVRFGIVPLNGGGEIPAVVFAYRREFDGIPVALEIIPLTPSGAMAATSDFSHLVGDANGAAMMTCRQRTNVNVAIGGLDALAMWTCAPDQRCYWAVAFEAALSTLPLAYCKDPWSIQLVSPLPPTPRVAKIWRRLGAVVRWSALHPIFERAAG